MVSELHEDSVGRGPRHWISATPRWMRRLTLFCLAVVAAGPYRSVAVPGDGSEGVAIMVALDVSESMDEVAGSRRRLDVAVDGIVRFLSAREHDLVGLVTFHRTSALSVPPMLDRAPLLAAARRARTETLGDGTALGVAVGFAADRLRAVEATSKVVILVTDGESNAGPLDPITAARAARALGQRVFVIEVGAGGGGSELLAALAAAGGGRHFPVSDEAALTLAYGEIDAMEPTRFRGPSRMVELPALGALLWVAAGFFLLELAMRSAWVERLA